MGVMGVMVATHNNITMAPFKVNNISFSVMQ